MEKYSILIVDDDPTVLQSVRQYLKEEFNIFAVTGGNEALRFFRSKDADLVLLDISMPDIDGHRTFDLLRADEKTREIPVIFLTGDDTDETEARGLEQGAVDVITKPVRLEILRRRILQHIQHRRADELLLRLQEQQQREKAIRERIQHDDMTGLLNKSTFRDLVKERLQVDDAGAFIVLDIDNFKYINDTFGHLAGDRLLSQFAELMRVCVDSGQPLCSGQSGNVIGRFGGDEFAIYISGSQCRKLVAAQMLELIRRTHRELIVPDGSRQSSLSIGIAWYPEHGTNYVMLFESADNAMLYVKKHGKNNFRIYSSTDGRQAEVRGRLDCTDERQEFLLKRRDGEEKQLWVKFGEYRLLWHQAGRLAQLYPIRVASVLLTVEAHNGSVVSKEEADETNARLTAFLTDNQVPGVFSWNSVNQLLMLLYNAQQAEADVCALLAKVGKHLKSHSVRIRYEITYSV